MMDVPTACKELVYKVPIDSTTGKNIINQKYCTGLFVFSVYLFNQKRYTHHSHSYDLLLIMGTLQY